MVDITTKWKQYIHAYTESITAKDYLAYKVHKDESLHKSSLFAIYYIMHLHTQACRLTDLPSIAGVHIKVHGSGVCWLQAVPRHPVMLPVGFYQGSSVAMMDDLEWPSVWWGQGLAYMVLAHKHMSLLPEAGCNINVL